MVVVSYGLGHPRAAIERGGDCRAYDLTQERNVHGPHVFATSTACRITNGLIRATVAAVGAAPALTVETYLQTAEVWVSSGVVTVDCTLLTALLTDARLVQISPEAVTVRLVAPVMADAFVTLRRGERMFRIQHGSTRAPRVSTNRRIRWTASPSPTGVVSDGRVAETVSVNGFRRFVASLDAVTTNAGAFSVTAAGVTSARFGAGAGTTLAADTTADMHAQLACASRPYLRVART